MGARYKYVGVVDKGMAMSLNAREGNPFHDTVCAAVMFTGDKRIVQRGIGYRKGGESERVLKARADRMAIKWQRYLERTGKRFELQLDAKRTKKEAEHKAARDKRNAIAQAAPEMLAMLERMVKALRFGDEPPLIEVDELVARLK